MVFEIRIDTICSMGEKLKPTPDFEKLPQFKHPLWLSGFLEIGSGMFFERRMVKKRGRVTPYVFPVISVGDHEQERLEGMKKIIGGRIKHSHRSRNIQLLAQGDQASWLAYAVRPYALSRRTIIDAFLAWSSADMTEDRVVIAEQFRGRRIISAADAYDYNNLVTIPEFVGGVIDARGSVNHKEAVNSNSQVSWIHDVVNFVSINRPLLEALQFQFGGRVTNVHEAGDRVVIRGESIVLKNDSVRWTIGTELMNELIVWTKPLLPLSNAVIK